MTIAANNGQEQVKRVKRAPGAGSQGKFVCSRGEGERGQGQLDGMLSRSLLVGGLRGEGVRPLPSRASLAGRELAGARAAAPLCGTIGTSGCDSYEVGFTARRTSKHSQQDYLIPSNQRPSIHADKAEHRRSSTLALEGSGRHRRYASHMPPD
ncbi:hypothetical protein VTN77DRAFT_5543 [Rasamsonia byssochlamydoides]|uniref:uncharacterized protein n=1 Tax=Rasamsonia byssochlamydoides TaxID=89139 RepID=UPI0037425276